MIPEAAVEAAAAAARVESEKAHGWGERWSAIARAVIEAAAPIMQVTAKAEAWDEGFAEGWDCSGDTDSNPYRTAK